MPRTKCYRLYEALHSGLDFKPVVAQPGDGCRLCYTAGQLRAAVGSLLRLSSTTFLICQRGVVIVQAVL